jgi:hypothetical protein
VPRPGVSCSRYLRCVRLIHHFVEGWAGRAGDRARPCDFEDPWFAESVVQRWRDGEALIPSGWRRGRGQRGRQALPRTRGNGSAQLSPSAPTPGQRHRPDRRSWARVHFDASAVAAGDRRAGVDQTALACRQRTTPFDIRRRSSRASALARKECSARRAAHDRLATRVIASSVTRRTTPSAVPPVVARGLARSVVRASGPLRLLEDEQESRHRRRDAWYSSRGRHSMSSCAGWRSRGQPRRPAGADTSTVSCTGNVRWTRERTRRVRSHSNHQHGPTGRISSKIRGSHVAMAKVMAQIPWGMTPGIASNDSLTISGRFAGSLDLAS